MDAEFAGLPGDLMICNCADCEVLLRSWRQPNPANLEGGTHLPRFVAEWVAGRPVCGMCLEPRGGGSAVPTFARGIGDPSPWQENAVRALEGE